MTVPLTIVAIRIYDNYISHSCNNYNNNSIEDAKQKAEHDRKMKLAEEKKQKVRKEVSNLRRQFYQLLLHNKELTSHLQLSTIDFIMDPEMEETLTQQTKEKVGVVFNVVL